MNMNKRNVCDIAKYILEVEGDMTTMKLQKLVYYSYVNCLTKLNEKLFDDTIEAWANGPVVRELFYKHQGMYKVDANTIREYCSSSEMGDDVKKIIDDVLAKYKNLSPYQLSDLTHRELPWILARNRRNQLMTDSDIKAFYPG